MKRFTDTEKWRNPWFRKLSLKYKLFWIFLCDNCDNAGIWEEDLETVSYFLKEDFKKEETLSEINNGKERIKILGNGKWFIADFIPFQYPNLGNKSNLHRNVSLLLKKYGVEGSRKVKVRLKEGSKNLTSKGKGKGISKGKEEDYKGKQIPSKFGTYKTFKEANNPDFKQYLQKVYPEVNIKLEFVAMETWLATNSNKRYKNYGKFCRGWIDRTNKRIYQSFGFTREVEPEITYEQPPVAMTEEERKRVQEELANKVKEISERRKL